MVACEAVQKPVEWNTANEASDEHLMKGILREDR